MTKEELANRGKNISRGLSLYFKNGGKHPQSGKKQGQEWIDRRMASVKATRDAHGPYPKRVFTEEQKIKIGNKNRGINNGMFRAFGELSPTWNGGITKSSHGYTIVRVNGLARYEHRRKAEDALGRKLKSNEVVHHINHNNSDNRNNNLLICTRGYHRQLHTKMAEAWAREHFPAA
jgi:co-chaperonin GroES (HSP10)